MKNEELKSEYLCSGFHFSVQYSIFDIQYFPFLFNIFNSSFFVFRFHRIPNARLVAKYFTEPAHIFPAPACIHFTIAAKFAAH